MVERTRTMYYHWSLDVILSIDTLDEIDAYPLKALA
jgi:hypothetical protein